MKEQRTKTCILTRKEQPHESLLRFVVSPDKMVVCDLSQKLPGRGAWLTCSKTTLQEAIDKKAFVRAFKSKDITIPDDLCLRVELSLKDRALAALSLALKSGKLVRGAEKVKDALKNDEPTHLIHAQDGAENSLKDVKKHINNNNITIIDTLKEAELCALTNGAPAIFFALSANAQNDHTHVALTRMQSFLQKINTSQVTKKPLENKA